MQVDHKKSDCVFFDFETQSDEDLREVNGRVYAQGRYTRGTVAAFYFASERWWHLWYNPECMRARKLGWKPSNALPTNCTVHEGPNIPAPVAKAVKKNRTFAAHNLFGFDRYVWARLWPKAVPTRWFDTFPLALACGLPGSLDEIGVRLTGKGKDENGHAILRKYFLYRPGVMSCLPQMGELEAMLRYCVRDVELLMTAYDEVTKYPIEADVIEAHQTINDRGVYLDIDFADMVGRMSAKCVEHAKTEIEKLTKDSLPLLGSELRSIPKMHEWLSKHGVQLGNLRRSTVEQFLADPFSGLSADSPVGAVDRIDPVVFDVLKLRIAALRITGAKVESAKLVRDSDGRLRDMFVYHQAHTGRSSARKVQLHNLPRPKKGIDVKGLIDVYDQGGLTFEDINAHAIGCRQFAQSNVTTDDVVSALIRPMLSAAKGNTLVRADLNAIECRGVAWIAGEETLLNLFREGSDPYCWMASKIFGRTITRKDEFERQVGKVTVLGCGYQLSEYKAGLYFASQGVDIAKAGVTPADCIEAFRSAFPAICGHVAGQIAGKPYRKGGIWDQVIEAAMSAVWTGSVTYAGKCAFEMGEGHLFLTLPSGRQLVYRNARIEDRVPGYCFTLGLEPRTKPTLVYTSKYGGDGILYGGKLTENIVQALCRDIMFTALVKAESVVLHMHDEIVCEVPEGRAMKVLKQLLALMTAPLWWTDGFPIAAEGSISRRYMK